MNVVECITEPEVAVTVTVEDAVVPVEGPVIAEVAGPAVVVEVLLQPANTVSAATVMASTISSRPPRWPRRRTKSRPSANGEPASSSPVRA